MRPTKYNRAIPDRLAVTCWCDRSVVKVPLADVRRGLTLACQRKACREAGARALTRRQG